jgi:hypothetical protein
MPDTDKQVPATAPTDHDIIAIEKAMIAGDLSGLSPIQRVKHYKNVCESLGLNPFTKPFDYLVLNGKLQLYALKSCTDQLRRLNNINLDVVSRSVSDGILTVHVRATAPDGRHDEDFGTVAFPEKMAAELRANMELKAVTKAKRRVTLSICGLGWLDETEIDFATRQDFGEPAPLQVEDNTPVEASGAVPGEPTENPEPRTNPDDDQETEAEALHRYDGELAKAAALGTEELERAWKLIPPMDRRWTALNPVLRRHQQHAKDIDDAKKRRS